MVNLAKTTENEWTRMWSIACLHNLAEDYCASSTGACPWVQVSFAARGVQPDRRGQSDHNAAVAVDSSSVRLSMHTQVSASASCRCVCVWYSMPQWTVAQSPVLTGGSTGRDRTCRFFGCKGARPRLPRFDLSGPFPSPLPLSKQMHTLTFHN